MKKYKKYLVKIKATGFIEVWSRGKPDKGDIDLYDIEITDWEDFDILSHEKIVEGHPRYVAPIDWDKLHPIQQAFIDHHGLQCGKFASS